MQDVILAGIPGEPFKKTFFSHFFKLKPFFSSSQICQMFGRGGGGGGGGSKQCQTAVISLQESLKSRKVYIFFYIPSRKSGIYWFHVS